MTKPIFVRPLPDDERQAPEEGLRSSDAFVLRRCQTLLASNRGEHASRIARALGCNEQSVRNAIPTPSTKGPRKGAQQGLLAPAHHPAFGPERAERLREMLHRSPRKFGKRRVVEADGLLGAQELAERVCAAFACPHYEHLPLPEKVA